MSTVITAASVRRFVHTVLAVLTTLGATAAPAVAQNGGAPPLARLQFDIVGIRLVVDPPALTVPKNIATQINTSLAVPESAGADVRDALTTLTAGAVVEAELRGPSIPPTRITVVPGQPIPIPAFALPGDYFLDGIRLSRNGTTILDATTADGRPATTIPIRVINEVFVTSVTSRPLSLDEIRERGIIIDDTSFQAVNFQIAFNIDGQPFTINMPSVLPSPELLRTSQDRTTLIREAALINQRLAATQTTLPPEFDRPGINFSIAALPFMFVPEDGEVPSLDIPPINGLVVIAGNVAFLNQFFKVAVMVANVAPDGSMLSLRDVTGTVVLPPGLDGVAGSPAQPGDDPLRLARLDGGVVQQRTPIVLPGPDGVAGTSDDIAVIAPQQQGEGEILLEGLKEGGHTFDVEIEAFLEGLPSGPVRMTGLAAGAVFVRNPTFAVTLAHPRTIRSGETYNLYATVTNTSAAVASLVSVNLDPLSISGAQLLSDPSVSFETLPSGESATAMFTLRAQRTGEVTFSSFTGEAAGGGGIRLFTGVGERNVALAPNAIILPRTADALPPGLIAAAQRVLGQAFSIATSPAEALPPGVLFVRRQTVVDRGLALAEAGERVQFGEPMGRVLQDLLLDWIGNGGFDDGFDQLLRTTEAGAAFLEALAIDLAPDATAGDVLAYQREFAQSASARELPHISVLAASRTQGPAPRVTVSRADGTVVTAGEPGTVTLPGGAALTLTGTSRSASLSVLAVAQAGQHVVEFAASTAGVYDLGIVIPGQQPGELRHLQFANVTLAAGGVARVVFDPAGASGPALQIDANGDGAIDGSSAAVVQQVIEGGPQVLSIRQLESSFRDGPGDPADPATYGLLVSVLFDKPVVADSAERRTNYAIASNLVVGAALQRSGRLAYLYLQQPIGGLTPRSMTVSGIEDFRGGAIAPTTREIVTVVTDGGRVFGQVQEAGGLPVPNALLNLTVVVHPTLSFNVATIRVDRNGSFDFDFVPRLGSHFTLTAQHPVRLDLTTQAARLRGAGEQLLVNPTFTGRGTIRGTLLAADGITPLAHRPVAAIPGAVLGSIGFQVSTNALGQFLFVDMPVGIFTLTASDGQRAFARAQGLIERAGHEIVQDLVLVTQPDDGGRLGGRVFLADGLTPAVGFTVYAGNYDRGEGTIAAVDSTTSDQFGSFVFERTLPPNGYDVVAVDRASGQIGTARATVTARLLTSVSIVLEATGVVEGVVFNARGQVVPGAVIAGGTALGTADANGFFRIEGVPAGPRTIDAGDPVTRRRGSAPVTVVPGQVVRISIALEARATITGRVFDAAGNPMPRISVRLPVVGGYTFVFTNNQGVYTFPDLRLGTHLIQAPGPSVDSLINYLAANGYDPATAFTSGDAPEGLGGPPAPSSGDRNAVLAAYERAVQSFLSVDESLLGLPMADIGGFGWNRVQLFQDSTTAVADVRFLSKGDVSGRTEDGQGRPTAALTRVTGLSVSLAGFPFIAELGRVTTDAATGAFAFGGIPRFDLATFQAAGVRGDFTLEAAQPFSPAIIAHRGQLNTANPNISGIALRFPSASETNGTLSGQVLMPDLTAGPAGTQVSISFGDLTVVTGPDGRFASLLPIPAGAYTVTATAPNGLRGQAVALVPAGGNVDIQVALLGLGSATVVVRRPNGVPVANALVHLERASFPYDRADGRTDATGTVLFVNLTEGPVGIVAEEDGTGLNGRASGVVVRETGVTIPLVIRASGTVTGSFRTADGLQAIPSAQIVLTARGVRAHTSTDGAGRFQLSAVPVGAFTVEASDPLTGRIGRASGELSFEGQALDVTVLQAPRGTIAGVVLNADGATPVAAARVRIRGTGAVRTDLQATGRVDGGFRFDGVSEGTFEIEATDPVSGFSGTATARIDSEGAFIDLVVTLQPFGSLQVTVEDHTGAPAGNATVAVSATNGSRTAAVTPAGTVSFEHLRLGEYRVIARSLGNPGDGGEQQVSIAAANEQVQAVVRMRGTGSVAVRVVAADGVTNVPSAHVRLNASAAFGSTAPGPMATALDGFTDAAGVATFVNVPIGNFFARAESAALAGVSTGVVESPGAAASITVRLGASAVLSGRVLLPDGATPAALAIVTLNFQSQSQLQTGVLQVTTGVDGTFAFSGIPLGTFTLSAFEVVSSGVRQATGVLSANGEQVIVGDLVLDSAGPRVVAVTPADRAGNVAPDAAITITFNEPVQPSTLRAGESSPNLTLLQGSTRIALAPPVFSDGNRTVALLPLQPLASAAFHTLSLAAGPDGVRDEAGFAMLDPLLSTFTVRDVTPPAILVISPGSEAQGVLPPSPVRVTFSEPVAGATVVLRNSVGAIVPGVTSLTAGGTAVTFAPQNFLAPNTFYIFTVSNVADLAGNPLSGGQVTTRFFTVDTLAPVISALQLVGAARAGATIGVQAVVAAPDTARVEFRTSEGFTAAVTSVPYAVNVPLPLNLSSSTVSAVAIDHAGNRSSVFEQLIAIEADAPPSVALVNVSGSSDALQGQVLAFEVSAQDDTALSRVLFSSVGAAVTSTAQNVAPGQTTFTTLFNVQVPANAASGQTFTVQAASEDSLGQRSAPASLTFTVRDGIRPVVTVLSPVNDAQVLAGQQVTITFDAADNVGLASVALVCNPSMAGCQSRVLPASVPAARETFTIEVPAGLQAPAVIALVVSATDTSGNVTDVPRTLRLADTAPPVVSALATASGATRVVAGELAALRATVADNIGVASLTFEATGGVTVSGTIAVVPPVASGVVPFTLAVPAGAPNGAAINLRVFVRDAAGNTSADRTLMLTVGDTAAPAVEVLAPAEGAQVAPGQRVTLRVRATDDVGIARVIFASSGAATGSSEFVLPTPLTVAEATFDVDIPADAAAGPLTLTASAVDVAGNSSPVVSRQVAVSDGGSPTVQFISPAPGASIDPRSPLQVVVQATDLVGVTEVVFTATGIVAATETRVMSPAASTTQQTFVLPFAPLPATGGVLTLTAVSRDGAGNQSTASVLTLQVQDVVAPVVASSVPVEGATGVDRIAAITVRFSEPMDPATLAGAVQLRRGDADVPTSMIVSAAGDAVTLTPVSPLAPSAAHAVHVSTAATDIAGLPLAEARQVAFTTAATDIDGPRVVGISPADGAIDVSLTATVQVSFDEGVSAASMTPESFAVAIDGVPVAGSRVTFSQSARFTPAEPFPAGATVVVTLTSAITDLLGNPLADASGNPVTEPLTFSFTTTAFGITSPSGANVIEHSEVRLEARAGNAQGIANVVFTVNGEALPAVTGPIFTRPFAVPSAAATTSLTIHASARNAQGVEVASDERTVAVVVGLRATPSLLGVPVGGTSQFRLSLSSPQPDDLPIQLRVGDPAIASLPVEVVVLPAGALEVLATVTGVAEGNTAVLGESDMGAVAAVVSVSPAVAGQTLTPLATPVGGSVSAAPSAGFVALSLSTTQTVRLRLLEQGADADVPVTVTSSNAAVAIGTAGSVLAGQQTADITITTFAEGVATLLVRVGNVVRQVTVVVGTPAPERMPQILAAPAGVAISNPPSAAQVVVSPGTSAGIVFLLLPEPAAGETPVTVSSSDPSIATATALPIQAGSRSVSLSIQSLANGVVTLIVRAGTEIRSVSVYVGSQPADRQPILVAPPAGVSVSNAPTAAYLITSPGDSAVVQVVVLSGPADTATEVSASTSDASVATVTADPIAAGGRSTVLRISAGSGGIATLMVRAGSEVRAVTVFVGAPPPDRAPLLLAPPVGLSVAEDARAGTVVAPAGAPVVATLGIQLLTAPAGAAIAVVARSSNPSVAALAGSDTVTLEIPAGQTVVSVPISTTGVEGSAIVTFEFGGERSQLLIVVGTPSASQVPVLVAPVVGVRAGG